MKRRKKKLNNHQRRRIKDDIRRDFSSKQKKLMAIRITVDTVLMLPSVEKSNGKLELINDDLNERDQKYLDKLEECVFLMILSNTSLLNIDTTHTVI